MLSICVRTNKIKVESFLFFVYLIVLSYISLEFYNL